MERRLAAIFAADVVGYSRLMGEDEAGTLKRLISLRKELVQPAITKCGGRIVKLMGDGLLAEFASVVEAVQCASDIQNSMIRREVDFPDEQRIKLRIGVNLGDIIVEGSDIYGDGVNVAVRLEGLAEPGGICVSSTVFDHVIGKVGLDFVDLGEQQVKNIIKPVRVFRARLDENTAACSQGPGKTLPLSDKPSIAVLPFDNMSGDPDQEYLADGIAEDILTGLSRVRWLFVISRSSSFAYKGQKLDVKRVAKELGVRYVLEGSVRKASQRVRVTIQLIDAAIDHHVWAERYDRKLDDIFELQDEITATILGTLEPELGLAEQERARRKPPESLNAWDLYLRGQWHLYRFTAEDNAEALRYFQQAIEIDPNFAASHTGLAYAHHLAAIEAFTVDPAKNLDAAVKAARRAVALDEKDAMAFGVLARVLTMRHEHDAALTASQMGNDLNPNIAQVRFGRAFALTLSDRMEEGINELDEATRLSPRDPNMWSFMVVRTWALSALGRHEEVVDWARRAAEQPNSVLWPNVMLASALGRLDRKQEARQALNRFHQEYPHTDLDDVFKRLPFRNPAHVETIKEGIRSVELWENGQADI